MHEYKVRVHMKDSTTFEVTVNADTAWQAKRIAQEMYPEAAWVSDPRRID